jgi:hypothetical protein
MYECSVQTVASCLVGEGGHMKDGSKTLKPRVTGQMK